MSIAGIVEGGCYEPGLPTLEERRLRLPQTSLLEAFHREYVPSKGEILVKEMSTEDLKEVIEYQRNLFASTHGFALAMRARTIRYLQGLLNAKGRKR
jgi:hypothetical protein